MSPGSSDGQVESGPRPAWSDPPWWGVAGACAAGWIADIFFASAILARATRGWPDGRLYDPSLGSHMGSDAMRFDLQVAFVAMYLAPWIIFGIVVGVRSKTLLIALTASWIPAIASTRLSYHTGTGHCGAGEFGETDMIVSVSLGLAAFLSFAAGAVANRSERRSVVPIAILVASALTVMDLVQWSHCSGVSKQVTREGDAVLFFGIWLLGAGFLASLGRLATTALRTYRPQAEVR